jgi:hypothetical protein
MVVLQKAAIAVPRRPRTGSVPRLRPGSMRTMEDRLPVVLFGGFVALLLIQLWHVLGA